MAGRRTVGVRTAGAAGEEEREEEGDDGEALKRRGDPRVALAAYIHALTVNSSDKVAAAGLRRLTEGSKRGIAASYVRRFFDGYAQDYERHLVGVLRYRGHEVIAKALHAVWGAAETVHGGTTPQQGASQAWRVMDVGCGTGLLGTVLRHDARLLVGVDVSPNMLQEVDRLLEGSILCYLI